MSALVRVASVEARLEPHVWPWAEDHAEEVDVIWKRRRAAQPALFDGRVLMVRDSHVDGDTMRVAFFETSYRRLLAHVELGLPDRSVANGFGMGALRGSDGAFLLGRMARHTANAGRLYFPAGTPDRSDLRPNGQVDLAGSILREIGEETGLPAEACRLEPGWTVVRHGGRLAFMREVRHAVQAREAEALIRAHLARQTEPELADVVVLRPGEPLDEAAMPSFLPIYLRAAFEAAQR